VVISKLNAWSMKQAEFATESWKHNIAKGIWKIILHLFKMICMCCNLVNFVLLTKTKTYSFCFVLSTLVIRISLSPYK
jgi:hypothetical protein